MEHSEFSERFGYLLWLRHLTTGVVPTFQEVGEAVGRSGVAVSAWRSAPEPPPDYRVHEPIAAFFGAPERWIIRNEGEAPEPELWKVWRRYRRADVRPGSAKHVISRANAAEKKATAMSKKRARGA